MITRRACLGGGLAILWAAASIMLSRNTAASQEFSADFVGIAPSGQPVRGKLNIANGKVRLQTPEVTTGFFLFTGTSAYFVRPDQRAFMDAKQSSQLAQIFIPVEPENPCDRWQAMARLSGAADGGGQWQCDRVGDEGVGERAAALFNAVSPRHRAYSVWIDKQWGFPLRVAGKDGSSYQLEHIEEKPQPPEVFVVPRGFTKFDPLKLIERIKKSDVWVEPPP